jgi:hypothetical protein
MLKRRRPGPGDEGEVMRCGDHELRVQVLHAGTRSEGRIGRLYVDGAEVRGATVGDTVVAADGDDRVTFEFRGDDRPHLWSVSGWVVAEQRGGDVRTAPGP